MRNNEYLETFGWITIKSISEKQGNTFYAGNYAAILCQGLLMVWVGLGWQNNCILLWGGWQEADQVLHAGNIVQNGAFQGASSPKVSNAMVTLWYWVPRKENRVGRVTVRNLLPWSMPLRNLNHGSIARRIQFSIWRERSIGHWGLACRIPLCEGRFWFWLCTSVLNKKCDLKTGTDWLVACMQEYSAPELRPGHRFPMVRCSQQQKR